MTPTLATRYTVKLFASSTSSTALATSPTRYVYVVAADPASMIRDRRNRLRPTQRLRYLPAVRLGVVDEYDGPRGPARAAGFAAAGLDC